MSKKWVYRFDEVKQAEEYVGGEWENVRGLLGGKGANLSEMVLIGVPVPPGFTVSTEACNAYLASGETFPEGLREQILEALRNVEESTGRKFGDKKNPLLISCRSGGKFSMPGMMDTVLDIGLNDETVKGLLEMTGDERFVYDSYRRLVQMFGSVVMRAPDEAFEEVLTAARLKAGVETDAELTADDWKNVTVKFKAIFRRYANRDFPTDPYDQLNLATEAVFKSWNGKRAVDYRNATGIPHDLGTAVSIQTMVFGNMGNDSATSIALTHNGTTGENRIEGDYLTNAQGEDVVAGIRLTNEISKLKAEMPAAYKEFEQYAQELEKHYRDMQDVEFTIEKGKFWMLQTRDGKRTAQAAVRIAVEMVEEGLISREEAVLRVSPEQVDVFLHPQFDQNAIKAAKTAGDMLAKGINVSPGAAFGVIALEADLAQKWANEEGKNVIMVRPETKPDDVHGMLASKGILTSRGGRTSHAALVARQFGKPAIVGVSELEIDLIKREISVKGRVFKEGEWISIDGTEGEFYAGKLETIVPDIKDPYLMTLLSWADEFRRLGVWANADYPVDAKRALEYGAEGIGLCRTEHMFFETERLPLVQKMILTDIPSERREALDELLPFQRDDFIGLYRVMDGKSVIIRLIDPPLNEFLPNQVNLMRELTELKFLLRDAGTLDEMNELLDKIEEKRHILRRVESLHESNPMLGLRGVRLAIHIPELTAMQVRAIIEAACIVAKEGVEAHPEIMIPLTIHVNELKSQRDILDVEAEKVMKEHGIEVPYKLGTMIELPRAALVADQIAEYAEFFSFGTNDLTQTVFGISRDDAEASFLIKYMAQGILTENPFAVLDRDGVGELMRIGVQKGRSVRPDLECGICGEHAGNPESIHICHELNLSYVSSAPFQIPIARLAAAHAALRDKNK
ncbi:MAG: pyruvate, phosphate dikinase [Deltaproteobacteria bacterium]|nr:pyruvate, phosphate dikinase [Deltaproteobacteria bacterium]